MLQFLYRVCTLWGVLYVLGTPSYSKESAQPIEHSESLFIHENNKASFLPYLQKSTPLPKLKTFTLCMQKALDGLDQLNAPSLQNLSLYSLVLPS